MQESLATIDFVIIFTYLGGIVLLGLYFSKYVHSAGDFFLAGKALPFWAIGMSIVVSDIGAMDMISGAGGAYTFGISQANFDWLGSMPAILISAFIFVPYYWRAGVYTIPEFLGRRYNTAVQTIKAVIWLAYLGCMLAIMMWMAAVFLGEILGWSEQTAIWVTVAIVGFYTVTGGLAAVVMTDVVQMIIMFVGTAALLVLSVWEIGGWQELQQQILEIGPETQNHFTLLLPHDAPSPYPWTGIVFGLGIVLGTAYFVGNQAIIQRALGARSEWDAKAGMLFGGFLKLFVPILVFVPGLAARAKYPHLAEPDTSVPILIRDLLPPGLTGLMFAAFFAALMSSVDSFLNSITTIFVSDIYGKAYHRLTRRKLSQRHGLILGRILTIVMIVVAGLLAPSFHDENNPIYVQIQMMFSLFQGPTLAVLLLGILSARANRWGALAGLLLGVAFTGSMTVIGDEVFPSDNPLLFISFWSFPFTLIVTYLVGLLTPTGTS